MHENFFMILKECLYWQKCPWHFCLDPFFPPVYVAILIKARADICTRKKWIIPRSWKLYSCLVFQRLDMVYWGLKTSTFHAQMIRQHFWYQLFMPVQMFLTFELYPAGRFYQGFFKPQRNTTMGHVFAPDGYSSDLEGMQTIMKSWLQECFQILWTWKHEGEMAKYSMCSALPQTY